MAGGEGGPPSSSSQPTVTLFQVWQEACQKRNKTKTPLAQGASFAFTFLWLKAQVTRYLQTLSWALNTVPGSQHPPQGRYQHFRPHACCTRKVASPRPRPHPCCQPADISIVPKLDESMFEGNMPGYEHFCISKEKILNNTARTHGVGFCPAPLPCGFSSGPFLLQWLSAALLSVAKVLL